MKTKQTDVTGTNTGHAIAAIPLELIEVQVGR